MEQMEIEEETVVDLSVSRRVVGPSAPSEAPPVMVTSQRNAIVWPQRRNLRPRTESRSYTEPSEPIILSEEDRKANGLTNGTCESDDDGLAMPPLPPMKELSDSEVQEREQIVRKLRDELRNEEMTLVLLKKIRQSHQMKENMGVVAQTSSQAPTHNKLTEPVHKLAPPRTTNKPLSQPSVHLLRGQPGLNTRGSPNLNVPPPVIGNRGVAPGLPVPLHQNTNSTLPRGNNNVGVRTIGIGFGSDRKESRHSPVPAIPPQQERGRIEETQTPAQRQAAAKLALRKQLEKTLLQIPPPKPPPPEMHFIPNPSNTEFIYLVGLEHVVDFITKDSRSPPPPEPFRCSQCSTNFTPVWKWEKSSSKCKEPKVICEQCVTSNVKKALKAEHTNRLKTAFVKALQQEQEIEQRLAQGSPQPDPIPVPVPQSVTKPATPKPPAPPVPSPNRDHLNKLTDSTKFNTHHAAAAIHQQLLRGLPQHQPLPAHMLPFSPLLYPYQLAMAQAAGGKGPVAAAAANIVELQRQAADIQRQYLLDMIPAPNPTSRHSINNWKT